ncbi:MAG: response regulator [Rhodobacteraceae bacterium]|nr:response regulator [Paracoccaceae bacterium]
MGLTQLYRRNAADRPSGAAPLIAILSGVLACLIAVSVTPLWQKLGLGIFGVMLVSVATYEQVRSVWSARRGRLLVRLAASLFADDKALVMLADNDGRIVFQNEAAGKLDLSGRPRVERALTRLLANPGAVQLRLQDKARQSGRAEETLTTCRARLNLSAQVVGADRILWRLEELSNSVSDPGIPTISAGPEGSILQANDPARHLIGSDATTLEDVFEDLPLRSGATHRLRSGLGVIEVSVWVRETAGGGSSIAFFPTTSLGAPMPESWSVIEELPVPLLKIARSGEILASNRAARGLVQREIGPNARLSDLFEGLGRPIIDWLEEIGRGQSSGDKQFLRSHGDGPELFVQIILKPAGGSKDPHLIAVLSDMTEFKSLEAQFVQSQKMQAIGQLAGGVGHDFNNLLTAISGHCDLLLLRHDREDQDYSDLIQIHQNSNRAAALVGQLLAFSRKQNLRPEALDLRDTLADLTHLLNRLVGEKVRLTLNHDPDLLPIRADKRQLEQVIMNLVVNARDAMPSGGEIIIETENLTLKRPIERDRASVPAGAYVLVKLADEGHGIPADKIPKIFEPFYTTKRTGEGTGLGLSTAYGIVKQTGGFIFVDSEEGRGTIFTLYFPAHLAPVEPAAPMLSIAPRPADRSGPDHGVILLVEDEAPVRAFAARALRLKGHTVFEAENAEAALELLKDPGMRVDIFVTDVIMPGKDGPTWVREALKDRPGTGVVFVSGYAEEAFGEHQALIANSVFLPKPFSLNDLVETVAAQLAGS